VTKPIDPIETALLVARHLDDRDYLRESAGILGVSDLLERALREAPPED
jgi:hypothetical protein